MDFRKADYYQLVAHVPDALIPDEVRLVLDRIYEVANRARPVAD